MVLYGIASFVLHRIFISFIIITFIAGKFFFIGVLLAIWAIATQVMMPSTLPVIPGSQSRPAASRGRAVSALRLPRWWRSSLFVAPFPHWTRTRGALGAEGAGAGRHRRSFIVDLQAPADGEVSRDQPLVRAEEPFLAARVAMLEAQLQELIAKYDASLTIDRVQAAMFREQIIAADANLQRSRERAADLVFRSPANGRFIVPNAADLTGRFVSKGQLIGYVVEPRGSRPRVWRCCRMTLRWCCRRRSVEVMLAGWCQPDAGEFDARCLAPATVADGGAGQFRWRPDHGRPARRKGRDGGAQPDIPARTDSSRGSAGRIPSERASTSASTTASSPSDSSSIVPSGACCRGSSMSSTALLRPGLRSGRIRSGTICATWLDRAAASLGGFIRQRVYRRSPGRGEFISRVDEEGQRLPALTDKEIRECVPDLRRRLYSEGLDEPLVARSFAIIREISGRRLGMRPSTCSFWVAASCSRQDRRNGNGRGQDPDGYPAGMHRRACRDTGAYRDRQ